MKKHMVQMKRRPAQTYIINLECECGGNFEAVRPTKIDMDTETVLHRCTVCGEEIYADGIYPCTSAFSDSKSEPFGMKDVLIK